MRTLSSDTDVSTEKALIRMLQQAPVYRHLAIVASLVKTTRWLSWHGMCDRYPDETPQDLARRFFFLLYPDFPHSEEFEEILLREKDEKR